MTDDIINESEISRQIKGQFVSKHIKAITYENSNDVKTINCAICNETILNLEKYWPKNKPEFIDITFNHLILNHSYEIHYGNKND